MYTPGMRVVAILSADENQVNVLGRGVYEGDKELPVEILAQMFGMPVAEAQGMSAKMKEAYPDTPLLKNPCIKLDNGGVVWGAQCWWGPEEDYEKFVNSRKVVMVNVKGEELNG